VAEPGPARLQASCNSANNSLQLFFLCCYGGKHPILNNVTKCNKHVTIILQEWLSCYSMQHCVILCLQLTYTIILVSYSVVIIELYTVVQGRLYKTKLYHQVTFIAFPYGVYLTQVLVGRYDINHYYSVNWSTPTGFCNDWHLLYCLVSNF
jgi:hypothetical protein